MNCETSTYCEVVVLGRVESLVDVGCGICPSFGVGMFLMFGIRGCVLIG